MPHNWTDEDIRHEVEKKVIETNEVLQLEQRVSASAYRIDEIRTTVTRTHVDVSFRYRIIHRVPYEPEQVHHQTGTIRLPLSPSDDA